MKVTDLTLNGIRSIPDGRYDLTDGARKNPLDVVIVTGPSASGKTSFLEAIAAVKEANGPYGLPPRPSQFLRRGAGRGRIQLTLALSKEEMDRSETTEPHVSLAWAFGGGDATKEALPGVARMLRGFSVEPGLGKFEYFAARRQLPPDRRSSNIPPAPRLRLVDDADKYAAVAAYLHQRAASDGLALGERLATRGVALRTEALDSLGPVKAAIAKLLPNLRLRGVSMRDALPCIDFERRDGTVVEIDQLSDAERQGILFAVTFVQTGLRRSIVLIDTPELYLHPRDHAAFLEGLSVLGSDNQIIVATTSTEILRSARPEQVIDLASPSDRART